MKTNILDILIKLSDGSSTLLTPNWNGGKWVNHKEGPRVSTKAFKVMLENGYIKQLNRVVWNNEPWFTISEKGTKVLEWYTDKLNERSK